MVCVSELQQRIYNRYQASKIDKHAWIDKLSYYLFIFMSFEGAR